MKKFLSVLLAIMMVVSTVSFAAPSVVTVTESATDANVVPDTTEETTDEIAELATVDSNYGQLVYAIDFEQDDFALSAFQVAYAQLSKNNIASYMDPSFDFSNVTAYTNASGDGFSNAKLVTENGNTYIQGDVAAGYDGFFKMSKYSLEWPDGYYTFSVDVKAPVGQVTSFAQQCNDTRIPLTTLVAFNRTNGDWQTVVNQTTDVVEGKNTGTDDTSGFYAFFVTPNNAAAGTVAYDNWKVYYKADKATLVVDANGRSGVSNMTFEGLTPNTEIPVSAYLSQVQAVNPDVMGFALTPGGEMVSTIPVEYYTRIYAVYGFDVSVFNNGNSGVSNVSVSNVDTRTGITVSELVSSINNTSSTNLRGISLTADGEPLADNYVVKSNSDVTLYMIWEADESEYGTLLFNIDFEQYAEGYEINQADNNYKTVETFDSDAITNGEFTINWQILNGGAVAVKADGNKYLRGNKGWAQIRINNSKYGAASAPMATGIYTFVADVIDFGTTGRKMAAISQVSTNVPAEMVDTWSGKTNTWDKVVGRWQNIEYRDMTWYFTDGATTDVGFDNIKLYFEPVDETVFYVTVNANGKSGASNAVVEVDAGNTVTVADLKAAMPGCIGIAETATGDMLPDSASILPKYNKTVYAVWGFDVTLKAGQNTEMSDVVVSGIDNRTGRGTTIGELISKINNTTDRTIRGLATASNGNVLPESTAVNAAATYYMIWELDEEELGTLILDIDFEKAGITAPTKNVLVSEIATTYNPDLVKENIWFAFGQSSQVALDNSTLKKDGTNTYLEGDANTTGQYYNFVQISEWNTTGLDWLSGTYTYVIDIKTEDPIVTTAMHVNGLGSAQGIDLTVIDDYSKTTAGEWETIAFQYNGKFSNDAGIGSIYIAPNISKTGEVVEGKIAVDNVRLYFKTDETVITLKPNGNTDLSDIEVPVSTSTGITVAELIEEVNKYSTTHKLLGIGEAATGDVLAEDVRITPAYQKTLYMHWASKSNNPMVNDHLGKLLFAIDFEREEVIENNWDGYSPLGGGAWGNSEVISKTATLYDTTLFNDSVNSKARFTTNDRNQDVFDAEIHTSADGENHFLQGSTGPQTYGDDTDAGTRWPQVAFLNYGNIVTGDGIYTVFIDAMGTGTGGFYPHTEMAGYNPKTIDPVTYKQISAWSYTKNSWGTYAYSYEITDGSQIPNSSVYFSFSDYNNTVAFDNYKLYYKPFTATITVDPGDYPEFGTRKVENISTTGGNTAQDIIDALGSDLEVCGRDFIWLVDEYGDVIDLNKELIIPGDVTYTIVWGEMNGYAPVTWEKNSIRYSTKVNSRGIRFAADVVYDYAYGETTSEYGWVIARTDVLENAGIHATSLTKESFGGDPKKLIIGKNYDPTVDKNDRKHFSETDDVVVITAVIYGVPEKYYKYAFTVRPYIVIDDVTYYGKPWSRSIYDTAKTIADKEYEACGGDQDLIDYIDTIIANAPAE